ncbi:hypothetical protein P691DRAFT_756022 [Macrolepiota fuliginosa MF-IS2]|uniref:Transcription activator of gluconeogenesis ERT1 n=1 Tax=Macrolepiota fuliginosa MF-IS2 TaxID=1400762 RepID=A0A9P5XLR5_9AGAR|nr:hypothetical protein P691DRAFT_756022 [Macrolepiota fuliginosa MF-IS2]
MPSSVDDPQSTPIFPIPLHMYPFSQPPQVVPGPQPRPKRRQVKNACTNCQKACKKCDDARPCLRCVKYGVSEECVDSQRKERKKGIKRGPYKKRDGRGRAARALDSVNLSHHPVIPTNPPSGPGPYVPFPIPPPYYGQYTPHVSKPGDPAPAYPYYVPQVAPPDHSHVNHPGDDASCHPQSAYYPIFHAPFPVQPVYPHSQGFITVRHNTQVYPNQHPVSQPSHLPQHFSSPLTR